METSHLRQFLKSLCSNSTWRYAIFWNLKDQNQKILTWEDGFCDYSQSKKPTQTSSDGIFNKSEIFSGNCETSTCNGSSNGDPIELAMANMLCCRYTFGEGPIGRVAYTGKHCWVLYNGALGGDFNTDFLTEYPDEWLLQFSAGIKTILLVPIVPNAVVQLGSLHTIPEDLVLVDHIKACFSSLQAWTASSPMSIFIESLDMPATTSKSVQHIVNFEEMEACAIIKQTNAIVSVSNQVAQPVLCQDVLDNSPTKNKTGVLSMGSTDVSLVPNNSINALDFEVMDSDTFRLACVDEYLHISSQFYNPIVHGEPPDGNLNCYPIGEMMEEPYINRDNGEDSSNSLKFPDVNLNPYPIGEMMEEPYINRDNGEDSSNSLKFPLDCELHKALVPDFSGQINECLWDSMVSSEDAYNDSGLICSEVFLNGIQPLSWESSACFTEEGDGQQLLEAVVANTSNMLDDAKSNGSNSIRSSTTFEQFNAASKVRCQAEGSLLLGDDCVPKSQEKPAVVANSRNTSSNSSNSSMMSTLIDEEPPKKGHGFAQCKKLCNGSQQKVKSSNNHRARPRDRQLIQDRIKELRELVPDCAKCSIDNLLDQAIKHMLFLGNVTAQAEKLRKWADEEVPNPRKRKSFKPGDGFNNGISWAFELEREVKACPILVEDLEIPGHLLIEMICSDYGLFLEIGQAIHELELTILKGTMERRTDNTWACFIVEASKGFHRVDIFWPLMRLLRHNKNSISSKSYCRVPGGTQR